MLSEAYKSQAELEIQLNVAKSNLKLVIANNEMLEDALKQNMSTQSKDVGWNRSGGESKGSRTTNAERAQSDDIPNSSQAEPIFSPSASVTNSAPSTHQENRFFWFRFCPSSVTLSRPTTPSGQHSSNPNTSILTPPSLPSLSSAKSKEFEVLAAELEKEKAMLQSFGMSPSLSCSPSRAPVISVCSPHCHTLSHHYRLRTDGEAVEIGQILNQLVHSAIGAPMSHSSFGRWLIDLLQEQ